MTSLRFLLDLAGIFVFALRGAMRAELYAVAALAGAALCFCVRVLAIRNGWRLSIAPL